MTAIAIERAEDLAGIAVLWNVLLDRKLVSPIGPLDVRACMIAAKLSAGREVFDNGTDAVSPRGREVQVVTQRNGNGNWKAKH